MSKPNDPKTDPRNAYRYNTSAWLDCSIPPIPPNDNACSGGWTTETDPEHLHAYYAHRATGMLTFVRFAVLQWLRAQPKPISAAVIEYPSLDHVGGFHRSAVKGMVETLEAIGQAINLSEQAAQVAIKQAKQTRSDQVIAPRCSSCGSQPTPKRKKRIGEVHHETPSPMGEGSNLSSP